MGQDSAVHNINTDIYMINEKYKGRFCGYCHLWIDGTYEQFDNHLNYCELKLATEMEKKRNERHPPNEGNSQVGEV